MSDTYKGEEIRYFAETLPRYRQAFYEWESGGKVGPPPPHPVKPHIPGPASSPPDEPPCKCGLDAGYGVAVNRVECPKHGTTPRPPDEPSVARERFEKALDNYKDFYGDNPKMRAAVLGLYDEAASRSPATTYTRSDLEAVAREAAMREGLRAIDLTYQELAAEVVTRYLQTRGEK